MKIIHRVPPVAYELREAVLDEDYATEVERSTSRLERRHAAATKRVAAALTRAERLADRASGRKATRSVCNEIAAAWVLVELRRDELAAIEREMTATPSSGQHRGRGRGAVRPATSVSRGW